MIKHTHSPERRVELLAPAGGPRQLHAALRFGADAVYGGLNAYSLRANAENFTWETLETGIRETHEAGARFYMTLNLLPYDTDLDGLAETARRALSLGADGALVADIGAFSLLSREVPGLPLHVSTQANVMNLAAARVFAEMGARRIVPARELSLEKIAALRAGLSDEVEIETFAHGAMCMSYSGRCMLSDFMAGRGANRGACAQPCRWQYRLVEEKRPGEIIDLFEDEKGTSFFSSYDLNMIGHLPELIRAGVQSLKIEGRMKTPIYAAAVTGCYRRALDLLLSQGEAAYRAALPGFCEELDKVSHRPYSTGFYFGPPKPAGGAGPVTQTMEYAADVIEAGGGWLRLAVRNRFFIGDDAELLTPRGCIPLRIGRIVDEETGETLPSVSVAGQRVRVPCPHPAEAGDFLRGPNRNHLPVNPA